VVDADAEAVEDARPCQRNCTYRSSRSRRSDQRVLSMYATTRKSPTSPRAFVFVHGAHDATGQRWRRCNDRAGLAGKRSSAQRWPSIGRRCIGGVGRSRPRGCWGSLGASVVRAARIASRGEAAQAQAMLRAGRSIRQAAKEVGVNEATVRLAIHRGELERVQSRRGRGRRAQSAGGGQRRGVR